MRKNKWTRILAAGMSLALVFSLAACQQKTEEEHQKTGETGEQREASDANGADKEPITLTWGMQVADAPGGDGTHPENEVINMIREKTGIQIEIITYDLDKFNMLAAGGDLPDIIEIVTGNNIVNNLISSEQIIPLEDLLDQYGENIRENIPDVLQQVKMTRGGGEHIYYLPTNITGISEIPEKNGYVDLKARYDIYKEIGSPEIVTEDDYLDVLKQMQDYQREKTGDDAIYALSSWTDSGTWPYIISYPFAQGYKDDLTNHSMDLETGEIESNFMEEDSVLWKAVRFFNKAYQLGIFDPDGLTQKNAQYIEKINNGKLLTTGNLTQPNPELCGEEAIMVNLPGTAFPCVAGVYGMPYPFGFDTAGARAISTNCQYPDRAMELLNWLDSPEGARLVVNGIQGEDWDYIDGVPQLIGDMLDSYKSGSGVSADYRDNRTARKLGYNYMYSGNNVVVSEDGYPMDLATTEQFLCEMATTAEKAFAQDFDPSFSYPGQVYDKWVKEGIVSTVTSDLGIKRASFGPPLSDEAGEKEDEASNYFLSNISKLIMARSEEDFNNEKALMIEKFREIGLEECDREAEQSREESFRVYEEIFGQ